MKHKASIAFFVLFLFTSLSGVYAKPTKEAIKEIAQESDQQIDDFSLSGFGERGKKTWDISGKTADIFVDTIKLKEIIGNLYGEKENIQLTADRGDFNKANGKVHLEDNVIITTSSGARLTTDALDWDRKNQLVSTNDRVHIDRGNMEVTAEGAIGHPDLKQINLNKDVKVEIKPEEAKDKGQAQPKMKDKIVITCDDALQIDYLKNIATFNKNVVVDREGSKIYSDIMDIYFITSDKEKTDKEKTADSDEANPFAGSDIDKIVARGNVKIVRGDNVSFSDEAIYTAKDKKITLSGRPKLILYSTEDFKNAPVGN